MSKRHSNRRERQASQVGQTGSPNGDSGISSESYEEVLPEVEETVSPPPDQNLAQGGIRFPAHWCRGQHLNMRRANEGWYFTLLGEEYDFRHPERGVFLSDYGQAQGFYSWWYTPQSADPRAR